MAIIFELANFLRVDHKLKDISVESCQVLSGTLKTESAIVIGEGISDFFDIVCVGEEVNKPVVDDE